MTKADTRGPLTIFSIIPIAIVICVGGISMLLLYRHLHQQDRVANRWRMNIKSRERRNNLSEVSEANCSLFRKVMSSIRDNSWFASRNSDDPFTHLIFWQAMYYMGAFLMCWPIYYVSNFNSQALWEKYGYWITVVTIFPLHGFFIAMAYFRNRISKFFRNQPVKNNNNHKMNDKDKCQGNSTSNQTCFDSNIQKNDEINEDDKYQENSTSNQTCLNSNIFLEEEYFDC